MKKILLLLLLPLCVSAQNTGFQKKSAKIDNYVNALILDWNISGLALVIVHKDQVIYAKGYGFREGYIYNNNMYTLAGIAIEAVSGKS